MFSPPRQCGQPAITPVGRALKMISTWGHAGGDLTSFLGIQDARWDRLDQAGVGGRCNSLKGGVGGREAEREKRNSKENSVKVQIVP